MMTKFVVVLSMMTMLLGCNAVPTKEKEPTPNLQLTIEAVVSQKLAEKEAAIEATIVAEEEKIVSKIHGTSADYVEGIGVQHDILSTRHVTEPTTVEYNSIPATSGNHWPQWSRCGFFEDGLPDERVLHNLEHSNIVVSYNLTTPEEVKELRDVMGSVGLAGVLGVTRFYDKIEPGTVALSAWGVSDTMVGIDEERINTFFSTYGGTLGPEGDIPCLNSGVMP